MTRTLKGLFVPADHTQSITEIEGSIHQMFRQVGIEWMEIIRTAQCQKGDFVAICDDEGHQKGMPANPRAQFLLAYPEQHTIVGPVILLSEAWDDDDPGMDLVNLSDTARAFVEELKKNFPSWEHPLPVNTGPALLRIIDRA